MKKITAFYFLTIGIFLTQCNKTTEEDKVLFEKSNTTSGFVWYKNSDQIVASSAESPHNAFFRVRFNSVAAAALTDNGKIPVGGSFPEGSLVVKELYDSQTGALKLIAAMEKSSGNSAAGSGWIWGEYEPDGKTEYSISKKGAGCTGCHSDNDRDLVRLFDLFP